MQKYTVKSLAVSGLGNKVFRCRATVSENNFPPGRAEELVKSGHLVKVVEEVAPEAPAAPQKPQETLPPSGDDLSVLSKKQIIKKLQELEVEFNGKESKEDLLALLVESTKPAPEEEKEADTTGSVDALKDALNQD